MSAYPWYLRLFFWNQRRRYGAPLVPALLWARVPRLFLAVALFYGAIERRASPLDRLLRLLVMVRVSQLNGCAFCVDLNTASLVSQGMGMEKVLALGTWRDSNLFDEAERAALDYAEAMTLCE
ncbi:MAG TPA: carboxymuconolactone decarboxylase family protein, partial [Sphingomonadaceae bacterium]|nr:carboxymuconolactone decarboxylase family protein [Sphingomonadaceae bacterium]